MSVPDESYSDKFYIYVFNKGVGECIFWNAMVIYNKTIIFNHVQAMHSS